MRACVRPGHGRMELEQINEGFDLLTRRRGRAPSHHVATEFAGEAGRPEERDCLARRAPSPSSVTVTFWMSVGPRDLTLGFRRRAYPATASIPLTATFF